MKPEVCLVIGGSDSCAGAGIQADLRTMQAHDVWACSAITALTAQTHHRIDAVELIPTSFLHTELTAIFRDYHVRVVKTGMLCHAQHIAMIANMLRAHPATMLVVDPVMIASSGKRLLDDSALRCLQQELLPLATLVTPNVPEAAALLEHSGDMEYMAIALAKRWNTHVLLKGGHGEGQSVVDLLANAQGVVQSWERDKRVLTVWQSHGTGCRLASAIAANLFHDLSVEIAIASGIAWLQKDLHIRPWEMR